MSESRSWHFAEGDRITPELTVMRRLGGGHAYEVFLAFDEITYVAVVAKVVRPDQIIQVQVVIDAIYRSAEVGTAVRVEAG